MNPKVDGIIVLPKFDVAQFLLQLGVLLDRRILFYIIPVLSFVMLYSKLPHKVMPSIVFKLGAFHFMSSSCTISGTRILCCRNSVSLLVHFLSSTYLLQLLLAECM